MTEATSNTKEFGVDNTINRASNFLRSIVKNDFKLGACKSVITRFPPEPNGYLHIGHAKSICVNFQIAEEFFGKTYLRFDDTNPDKESQEYIDAIKKDIEWLGFTWTERETYTSMYFDKLYEWAIYLIKKDKAYICDLSAEEARRYRGTLTVKGRNSPFRNRSIRENLEIFKAMKDAKFLDGERVLRAKIDMSSANMNLRDPILYRIRHNSHHQTGKKWCIYPSYDFAHGQCDTIEQITHSICTLEFEDHRPLYNWFLDNLPIKNRPTQYEFSRLNLTHTVTSKRKLKVLIDNKYVEGWDDPRLPTISGLRRRGYTANSIKNFCDMIGTNRSNGTVELQMLECKIREELDAKADRAMCVLNPLKVIITNLPQEKVQNLKLLSHPKNSDRVRNLPFTREIYIDRKDFMEVPIKGYKRLFLGGEVRLRGSYIILAKKVIKDKAGLITELHCTYDVNTLGKKPENRKVKGVIHWVAVQESISCEIRLYDRLFLSENPEESKENFLDSLNPNSLKILTGCRAEMSVSDSRKDSYFQFEREGYFCLDSELSNDKNLVFNRTISLRSSWKSN